MNHSSFISLYAAHAQANGIRFDANETAFLTKQLEALDSKIYETKYPSLIARDFATKVSGVPEGAQTYTWAIYDLAGEAGLIENYAGDLPSVSVQVSSETTSIRGYGSSYQYSVDDIAAASMGNFSLPDQLPLMARRAVETKIDRVCAIGDTKTGAKGILNNASVDTVSVITGSWTAATTAANIIADVEKLIQAIYTATVSVFSGERLTIIVPQSKWVHLQRVRSDASDTTIQEMLQKSHPDVDFVPWYLANTAGSGGGTVMVGGYFTPETIQLLIPREFTQESPQQKNLAYYVPCHARCGGAVVRYPVAFAYMHGV
jgi:hypothetical protein